MDGDEGKNIQRDTVYGNKRVPPLADTRQRSQSIPVELRNLIKCVAIEEVSELFLGTPRTGL